MQQLGIQALIYLPKIFIIRISHFVVQEGVTCKVTTPYACSHLYSSQCLTGISFSAPASNTRYSQSSCMQDLRLMWDTTPPDGLSQVITVLLNGMQMMLGLPELSVGMFNMTTNCPNGAMGSSCAGRRAEKHVESGTRGEQGLDRADSSSKDKKIRRSHEFDINQNNHTHCATLDTCYPWPLQLAI